MYYSLKSVHNVNGIKLDSFSLWNGSKHLKLPYECIFGYSIIQATSHID